jgi:hypothetical protein
LQSFAAYFDRESFLIVGLDGGDDHDFVARSCEAAGVRRAIIAMLPAPTSGQAETVDQGLAKGDIADDSALTIFNIDTFRPGFRFPSEAWWARSDGYLEVFRGAGENWSYVRPSLVNSGEVEETAEKRAISDLCCTGLYHFARVGDFRTALAAERRRPSSHELFVAPLYNHLIAAGRRIHFARIEAADVVFCGVPAEYEALRARLGPPMESQTRG